MLNITRFVLNPFQENTYLVYDQVSREAIVVDPGMYYEEENKAVDKFLADNKLRLTGIVNTHLHLDHCFGAEYLKQKYGAGLAAHKADAPLGDSLPAQCRRFGIKDRDKGVTIDRELVDGDVISIGDNELKVIHVPGHSPGGIALYCAAQHFVLVGDSLFNGSIGRTDLEGGNHATLIGAITDGLLSLPDDTTVLSGHGEPTTIGYERSHNPYL